MLCVSTTPLLLHDNAPAHKALVAVLALRNLIPKNLVHTYSPDLATYDFHLCFPIGKDTSVISTSRMTMTTRQQQKSGYRRNTKHLEWLGKLRERYSCSQ